MAPILPNINVTVTAADAGFPNMSKTHVGRRANPTSSRAKRIKLPLWDNEVGRMLGKANQRSEAKMEEKV